jgi:DNA-binding GntR family transcriptional regulator
MDEAVGRQLAATISADQLKAVRAMVDAMEKAVKAGDADTYHLLNLDFHDKLVEFTGNRKLTTLYRRLINELSLFRRLNLADAKLLPISAGEHRAIVKAIASGDPEAAGRAMRDHVMVSKDRTVTNNSPQHPSPKAAVSVRSVRAGRTLPGKATSDA